MKTTNIHPNIRAAMAQQGYTLYRLAEKADISTAALSRKLAGKNKFFLDEALRIRSVLNGSEDLQILFYKE